MPRRRLPPGYIARPARVERTYELLDHLCAACGGRMLKCVTGNGMTPGGNPVFICADCERGGPQMSPEEYCWCGFARRRNDHLAGSYQCLSFKVLKEAPYLLEAFLNCGCDPERGGGSVGIVTRADLSRLSREHANRAPPPPPAPVLPSRVAQHVYDGPMDPQQTPCEQCGRLPRDPCHFMNGGVVCDMERGACACGAFHNPDDPRGR